MEPQVEQAQIAPVMTVKKAFLTYIICLAAVIVVFTILNALSMGLGEWPYTIIYFGVGIYLTKCVVLKLIAFHEVFNTVSNQFSLRVMHILFWPITVLYLLIKLAVISVI